MSARKIKKAVVFPGQGSQFLGMGADMPDDILHDLRAQTEKALGEDLASFLFYLISQDAAAIQGEQKEKLQKRLNQNAQLTTFITSWGMYLRDQDAIGVPDYVTGHSLGLYTALCAAGVISFPELLPIVKLRQSAMNDATIIFNGGMSAVISNANRVSSHFFAGTNVKIANFNTPTQRVISGLKTELLVVEQRFRAGGFRVIPLRVAGAFHHPDYMVLASKNLDYILNLPITKIREPVIPLVLDTTGQEETDAGKIKKALVNQVVEKVRWVKVIRFFISQGITRENIIEVGSGRVLTKMLDDFPELQKKAD